MIGHLLQFFPCRPYVHDIFMKLRWHKIILIWGNVFKWSIISIWSCITSSTIRTGNAKNTHQAAFAEMETVNLSDQRPSNRKVRKQICFKWQRVRGGRNARTKEIIQGLPRWWHFFHQQFQVEWRNAKYMVIFLPYQGLSKMQSSLLLQPLFSSFSYSLHSLSIYFWTRAFPSYLQ